ncbi:hypothetical protein JYT22_00365 [Endomicrobium sp. AH-315-J14]|nr:hypothetical protein [Endomicrobium sp. AH-315-J14]
MRHAIPIALAFTAAAFSTWLGCSAEEVEPVAEASCNPFSNEGCADGTVCDSNFDDGSFACFAASTDLSLCEACADSVGWCASGLHCREGQCARFCCQDEDCGDMGSCEFTASLKDIANDSVGLCVLVDDTTDPATSTADCTAPDSQPSMGSCVGLSGAGGSG